jgi:hypothetical protein
MAAGGLLPALYWTVRAFQGARRLGHMALPPTTLTPISIQQTRLQVQSHSSFDQGGICMPIGIANIIDIKQRA